MKKKTETDIKKTGKARQLHTNESCKAYQNNGEINMATYSKSWNTNMA